MTRLLFGLALLCAFLPTHAQNKYPASGDALIHGLTIGTGPGGYYNTALGYQVLYVNSTGQFNTAVGADCMNANTSGGSNTGAGSFALGANTSGNLNTGIGYIALDNNTTGSNNVAVGPALYSNINGNGNVGVGSTALGYLTSGNSNVAMGPSALANILFGSNLVAVGDSALLNNTAADNTAIGSKTLMANTSGAYNTALGYQTLYSNTTGYSNTASGLYSLYYNTSGSMNTAIGMETLMQNTTGAENTAVGTYAGTLTGNLTNVTAIGYDAWTNSSNTVIIGNNSVTSIGGFVGWSTISDGRFKKNIQQNVPGLTFINKLTPISYTLDIEGIESMRQRTAAGAKGPNGAAIPSPSDDPVMKQAMKEKSAIIYTGFIAQDVDKAAQSIGYHFSGVDKPKDDQQSLYSLRYSEFVVPLVKAVQELSIRNDSLQQANAQLDTQVTQLNQRLTQLEQLLGVKTAAGENSSTVILSSARLFQNVPNPFNQTTQINYYLPANAGTALLLITGVNGETIRSVALSGTGAGQVSVQTAQLAAGTYMYSLVVDGNLVDTKKMVLVK